MNSTGKKNRKNTGMNRHELHFFGHAKKSAEARSRKGWAKAAILKREPSGQLIQK